MSDTMSTQVNPTKAGQATERLPSEEMITNVVLSFYDSIRQDDLLGPVFGPRIDGHWEDHLTTMVDFWSSVILTSGRYQGQPLSVHGQLGHIGPAMWQRWIALFTNAARENCPPYGAQVMIQRAEQIADHLSRTLARRASNQP